jgi:DNA-directed RNA polymerase subunit RPC12/RpoP
MKRHPLERIVSLPREGCYADDGSPIKCPECGHAEFTEKMRDFIDFGVGAGPATEIEYFCGACGESVAYWAYGSFDPAYLDHKQANAGVTGAEPQAERPR